MENLIEGMSVGPIIVGIILDKTDKTNSNHTIGVEFGSKIITIDDYKIKL